MMSQESNPQPADRISAADRTSTDSNSADSYTAAMTELRSILVALEQEDADVEELAKHVERAGQLIVFCRERINHAEMRVSEVLASLQDPTPEQPTQG